MKSVKKLILILVLALTGMTGSVFAQQITKFAVVDTSRVYQAFFRKSNAVRNYEKKREEFQAEIDKATQEIQTLYNRKLEYDKSGDSVNAQKLQTQIEQKTAYLTEYTKTKNAELQNMKQNLQNNDAFYKKLYAIIEDIAESGGYSMVLSLQQNNAILWYSSSVDITDDVIRTLGLNN
ncbi:MAG TPA: hypothetical protein DEO40_06320 [Treponema sp.]|nr:OmpH family outer membrane protein [Treponema sp.]HAK68027.1 hypothetical protein [Treponema sp.]HBB42724.1 hypothetical protein [Treponema sp.]HCA20274.1 hypothetical protein [Treponema sp.]